MRPFDGLSDSRRTLSRTGSCVAISESDKCRIFKSGEDKGSAHIGPKVIGPIGSKFLFDICCWPGHGSPAHRKVASRASLTDVGAHAVALVTDEADEIDDARDDRDELSETIDSGEDEDDDPEFDWTDGRRLDI